MAKQWVRGTKALMLGNDGCRARLDVQWPKDGLPNVAPDEGMKERKGPRVDDRQLDFYPETPRVDKFSAPGPPVELRTVIGVLRGVTVFSNGFGHSAAKCREVNLKLLIDL